MLKAPFKPTKLNTDISDWNLKTNSSAFFTLKTQTNEAHQERKAVGVKFSLVRFNSTMDTISSFWCHGCVQTDVLSEKEKDKTKCTALVRFQYKL